MQLITIDQPGEHKIRLTNGGEYRIEVVRAGAEVEVVGAFATHAKDTLSVNLTLVHAAPHTRGRVTLKGVAFDQSHLKFQGKVVVGKNCPDTQSFLEERLLLLSDQARAEAIPELEILTDDVRCSHAASISKVPADQLFYLQSRGLTLTAAQDLIVAGFLEV